MDQPHVAQQTSTTVPVHTRRGASAQAPRALGRVRFHGPLQWALEGRGRPVVRPLIDFLMLCAATVIALGGPAAVLDVPGRRASILVLPLVVMALFYARGLYRRRLRALVLDGVLPVLSGISVGVMAVATLSLLINDQPPEQSYWVRGWIAALVAVSAGRITLVLLQRWARSRRLVGRTVLIMGAGMVGAQVARRLESSPDYGLVPIGFLDEDPRAIAEVGGRDVPVLGAPEQLDEVVARTGARNVIVAFSTVADARISRLIQHCQERGIEVAVVPRMFDTINDRVSYDHVGGLPLLSFAAVDPEGLGFELKHALDRVGSLAMLLLLSPVLLAAAIAVRVSSPGPILFRQRRVGRDGREFDLLKFRSMREPEPALASGPVGVTGIDFLLAPDTAPGGVEGEDRRTAVGRFMRRTSIDELPQLLNVLRGEMSLVGPRPERPEYVKLFRQDILRYGDRHRVRSGITGWAQVHGLRGQTSLEERVELDNYYIAHWSLALDLKILVLTLVSVIKHAE